MNAVDFCRLVEARLGWEAPTGKRSYQAYTAEAGKVKRRIATQPSLYTWENLLLAVELCARKKMPRTPIGVFAHVEQALELARESDSDIEQQIREAIAYEVKRGDPAGWATRFSRTANHYRKLALIEWRESVR